MTTALTGALDRRRARLLLAGACLAAFAAAAQGQAPASPPAVQPPADQPAPGEATAAAANPAAPAPGAAAEAPATGTDIVVTARFRNETLQSVPIAVSVVNGASAAAKNLNNIQDLSTIVPTVDFRAGSSNKDRTIFVRGVGTITTSPGVESSVSTVVDGVVLVRPGQQTLDLGEIDRVEVLRGPQGTLFGKNASAGVINIVTKAPTDTDYGHAEAGYYEGGEYRGKLTVSGPIVPGKLDYLLSGIYGHFRGNVTDLGSDSHVNGYTRYGGRAKLLWTPTETFRVTLGGDYLRQRDDVPTGVVVATSQIPYGSTVPKPGNAGLPGLLAVEGIVPSLENRTIDTSVVSSVVDQNYGGSIQADLELGDYTVTSISAYREWKNRQHQDQDFFNARPGGVPVPGIAGTSDNGVPQGEDFGTVAFHQLSEELRLASPKGGFVDYVLGLYALHAKTDETYRRNLTQAGAQVAPIAGAPACPLSPIAGVRADCGVAAYGITATNLAAFGEANINFTPHFRAIAGGRVIYDKLSYYHARTSTAAAAVPAIQPFHASQGSTDNTDFSARAGLQYDIVPQATAYATYSRGYKGQAYNVFFNMRAQDEAALKPETSNSYEVGLKGSAFDHRVSGSIAAYLTKFDNFQANFPDVFLGTVVTRLINAGKVSTRGVETDVNVRPVDPLSLSFSFAYTKARIDHFICPIGASQSCNVDGQPLPFAPKWKLHGEATYTIPLGGVYGLELNTDYGWQSRTQYQLTETPDTSQPSYGIWNASVAIVGKGELPFAVRAVVKNIADRNYSSYLLPTGSGGGLARFVPRDAGRYFGVNLSTDF